MASEGFEIFQQIKRMVSRKIHREKMKKSQIKILLTQKAADLLGSIENNEIKNIKKDYSEKGNRLFIESGLLGCKVEIVEDDTLEGEYDVL